MRQIEDRFREDASEEEHKDYNEGIESVLFIRCMAHRHIPQYNRSEHGGGECAACQVELFKRAVDDLEIMLRYAATGRCAVCGWPLAPSANEGCVQGNCSFRAHDCRDWQKTYSRRAKLLTQILARTALTHPESEGA